MISTSSAAQACSCQGQPDRRDSGNKDVRVLHPGPPRPTFVSDATR